MYHSASIWLGAVFARQAHYVDADAILPHTFHKSIIVHFLWQIFSVQKSVMYRADHYCDDTICEASIGNKKLGVQVSLLTSFLYWLTKVPDNVTFVTDVGDDDKIKHVILNLAAF